MLYEENNLYIKDSCIFAILSLLKIMQQFELHSEEDIPKFQSQFYFRDYNK